METLNEASVSERESVARDLAAILSRRAPEDLRQCLDDAVVMEFPYAPPGAPRRFEGLDAVVSSMGALPAMFSDFSFEPTSVYEATDKDAIIMEATSRGTLVDGGSYANRYITLLRFRGNRIVLWREYFDPMRLPGMAPAGEGEAVS